MRQWLGSIAFTSVLFVSVVLFGPVILLAAPFGYTRVYRMVTGWAAFILALLARCCRLDFTVAGLEHLPAQNTVIVVKHSSTWETIAQLTIFPRQTWVLKRELLWAPVLGWVLLLLRPIAIDRKAGRSAVQQVIDQGRRRLDQGFWVVIFPEGTRVPAGEVRRYGLSGALLASASHRPIVPVAHNAGDFWPRRGLLKKSGTVRVVIGPPIPTANREPRAVMEEAQQWIEKTLAEIRRPQAAEARR